MTQALHELSILEAAALIRDRQLSPVELVEAHLERIASLDGRLHAFITVDADGALAAAREAEAEIAAGRYRGHLHGIPIAHKDIIETRGVRTTAHSNALRDWVPARNATVVRRLQEAGAVSLGKTSLHEFAFGSPGADEAFPAACNPWNTDHMPGSSSSGSGAAVAAGLVMGATGTDTGGSIRHPAAVCGIVGMKPTYGRVSCSGVIPLAPGMDHVGPMTRTVADNATMLRVIAGHDTADPAALKQAVPDFGALLGTGVKGLRIGVARAFMETIEHTPDMLRAFEEVQKLLGDLGARLEDVDPDGLADSHDAGTQIITYEAYQYHRGRLEREPEKLGRNFRDRFAAAADLTPDVYDKAREAQRELRNAVEAIFRSGVGAIINPARERPAQTMAELRADPLGKRSLALRMYSLTGHPALVLPMGFSGNGLPLGLQIAGPLSREDLVYQVAHAYEQAAGWWRRKPAL